MIENFADGRVEFVNDQIAKAYRIDEMAFVIDDIKLIERLAIPANFAQMSQDVVYGPTVLNGNVFGRHTPPDRFLGIAKQIRGYLALFGRKQVEQLLGDRSGHFLEQSCAIVWRKVIEDLSDLLVTQGLHELFLVLEAEIFEDLCGQLAGQNAEQYCFVVGLEVGKNLSQIGCGKTAKNFPQRSEIALLNQFDQLWLKQIANHGFNQPQLNCNRKGKTPETWNCFYAVARSSGNERVLRRARSNFQQSPAKKTCNKIRSHGTLVNSMEAELPMPFDVTDRSHQSPKSN
jgi:hypothetical protein